MSVPEDHAGVLEPSPWVLRFASLVPVDARVLDVACGSGRHARFFASRGCHVTAVDRDARIVEWLAHVPNVEKDIADLENGPWPYVGREFDAVIITNYLHRPLFTKLLESIAAAGVLIYETFARGNENFGRPANPEFLLRPGELLTMVDGWLRVIAYEDLYVDTPKPAMIQRICARLE